MNGKQRCKYYFIKKQALRDGAILVSIFYPKVPFLNQGITSKHHQWIENPGKKKLNRKSEYSQEKLKSWI